MTAPRLTACWIAADELGPGDRHRWRALSAAAGVNPFAAPWFVSPVLALEGGRLLVAVDEAGGWHGALRVALSHRLGRVPLPHWAGVRHAHQFDGAPLIAEGHAQGVWRCLLAALAQAHPFASALRLSLCHKGASAIEALCAERPPALVTQRHERPLLRLDTPHGHRTPRRLRLDRQWTRFAAAHAPTVRVLAADEPLDRRLDALTTLEEKSWKGRAGSAIGSDSATARLFGEVLRGAHAAGALRMVAICVAGQPVAINSFFVTRDHAHGFKASFDADFGKFAPGLQAVRLAGDIAAGEGVHAFDSCAAGLATPIAELWPDRRTVADIVVPLGRRRRVLLTGALAATRAWHGLKRVAS